YGDGPRAARRTAGSTRREANVRSPHRRTPGRDDAHARRRNRLAALGRATPPLDTLGLHRTPATAERSRHRPHAPPGGRRPPRRLPPRGAPERWPLRLVNALSAHAYSFRASLLTILINNLLSGSL